MKQLPSLEKTIFLICEDVRNESGNKISLLGIFTGGDIVVGKEELVAAKASNNPALIPSLTFFVSFQDGEGQFVAKVAIKDPSGKDLINKSSEATAQTLEKRAGSPMNLVFKVMSFPIELGKHTVEVILDEKSYLFSFFVRNGI